MGFLLGLAAGLLFAAAVWRLSPQAPPPGALEPRAPIGSPASGPLIYTVEPLSIASSPNGTPLALLAPATPLVSVAPAGQPDGWIPVEADLYRTPDAPAILFQDPARLIRTGQLTEPRAATIVGTLRVNGSSWDRVRIAGWVPAASASGDLADLWLRASVAYDRACGRCHAVYPPGRFTSREWPAQLRAMVPRSSLTQAQVDLVLKWLQVHAR